MPLNSLLFLFFFFSVCIIVNITRVSHRFSIILCASFFFYAWAGLSSIIYLTVITLVTYIATKYMEKYDKKIVCGIAISIIIALLFSSKYSPIPHFINNSTISFYKAPLFIVPIGVSFYALQAIGLLIDIKKNIFTDRVNSKDLIMFFGFFPISIAGPIHRAKDLIPQFNNASSIDNHVIALGLKTMLFGFFCKLLIADKLSLIIDPVFNNQNNTNGLLLYISTILFSLQIYFDFWGYSLIAIGMGKCLGYKLKVNFNNPYSSASIKEFWNRWHISLSQWMRDYIYIPIGGSKHGYVTFVLSIFVTFLFSGFWHGLSAIFFIWGVVHMIIFLIDDLMQRFHKSCRIAVKIPIRRIFFLLTIPFTWLIFRSDAPIDVYNNLKNIFLFPKWSLLLTISYFESGIYIFYLSICILVTCIAHSKFISNRMNVIPAGNKEKIFDSLFIISCLLLIILFGDMGTQQFLYFNF